MKSLKRTSATRTPYARTRRDLISVGVLEVLKAMEKTAQVIAFCCLNKLSLVVVLLLPYVVVSSFFFQLFCLRVLRLVDRMHFANKEATGPSVPAIWASKATDTTAQVNICTKASSLLICLRRLS